VLAPVAEVVTLGEADGVAGTEAGPPGDAEPADEVEPDDVARALTGLEAAAELLDELQAVTSKAAQASAAHPPACRALRAYVVNMDSTPVRFP
jgi:hypothetical protein